MSFSGDFDHGDLYAGVSYPESSASATGTDQPVSESSVVSTMRVGTFVPENEGMPTSMRLLASLTHTSPRAAPAEGRHCSWTLSDCQQRSPHLTWRGSDELGDISICEALLPYELTLEVVPRPSRSL